MTHKIKMICCICGEHFGTKPGGTQPGLVSHGYCDPCAVIEKQKIKKFKKVRKSTGRL